ncbi:MAG TPA: porin [Burkholderiaceae bacterium]|jgi:predicted porin
MKQLTLVPVALAALAACSAASAQSSVQIYGQVTAAVEVKDHQGAGAGGKQYSVGNNEFYVSHIGFRGTEDLGDGMKAMFRLESGLNTDTGANIRATKFFDRQAFVGIDLGAPGAVTAGRQFSAGVDRFVRTLDIFNVGGQGAAITPLSLFGVNRFATPANCSVNANSACASTVVATDNRVDDSVKYRVAGPMGLEFGASVGLNDGEGRSYSMDVGQTTKDYAIGLIYMNYQSPVVLPGNVKPKATTWAIGGNVPIGPVRLFATYLNNSMDPNVAALLGKPAQKNKVIHLGARYNIATTTDLTLAYYGDKGTNMDNVVARDGHKNTYIAAVDYYLSKRSLINVGYFRNSLTGGYQLDPTNATALSGGATHATGIAGLGFSAFSGFMVGVRQSF